MADEYSPLPWLKDLGEDGQREFYEEILQISVLAHELGTPLSDYAERINACVAGWKSTAEACSDPELKRILARDQGFNAGDFVEAPRPELPQRVHAPQKLCLISAPTRDADGNINWCKLAKGHTGPHRSRHGFIWAVGNEIPEPRHGE